jgi:hypothetical protein
MTISPLSRAPNKSTSQLFHSQLQREITMGHLASAHLYLLGLPLSGLDTFWCLTVEDDFALFEVAACVFVDEDEGEVVACRVFLVYFAEGWC